MKNWFHPTLALLLASALIGPAAAQTAAPQVSIDTGALSGAIDATGARVFKGIPYAAAPVGDLRWREPRAPAPWSGARDASDFGDRCQQAPFRPYIPIGRSGMSENCLFLNVWAAPDAQATQKRPVLVWIHGGGFSYGFSNQAWYDGGSFVQKGVVYVSINYRVGVMGFLAHPELTAESVEKTSGNYGILDQIAALQWIKRNIAAFGGDPDNVTIFGESAGSISVSALTASPLAKGLFTRAIGASGAGLGSSVDTLPVRPHAVAQQRGTAFASAAQARDIAALRALPAGQLVELGENGPGFLYQGGRYAPNIDGYLLKEPPEQTFARGAQNNVALIAGWNLNEGNLFMVNLRHAEVCKTDWSDVRTPGAFTAQAQKTFGADAPAFLNLYPHGSDAEAKASAEFMVGDLAIAWPTWKWADLQGRSGAKVYAYFFTKKPPPQSTLGLPTHAAEIPYAFDNQKQLPWTWDEADPKIARAMASYYANFARNGDPNGPGLPAWPLYDPAAPERMMFSAEGANAGPLPLERLRFIDTHRHAGPWCPDVR